MQINPDHFLPCSRVVIDLNAAHFNHTVWHFTAKALFLPYFWLNCALLSHPPNNLPQKKPPESELAGGFITRADLVEKFLNFQLYALVFREKANIFAYFWAAAQEWAPRQFDKINIKLF